MTVDFDDYVAALQSCIVGWTTGLHISNDCTANIRWRLNLIADVRSQILQPHP